MGNRKTIIAIHGAGMTGAVWGGIVPHLLDHSFRALTLPGHDPKSGTAPLESIAAMAEWVKGKLDGQAQDVVLLGHSMGALVALAAADAKEVAGVALLGAGTKMPVNADLLKTARETPNEAIGMVIKWGVFPGHPQVGAVRTVLGSFMHNVESAAIGCDLAACNDFANGAALAKDLAKPALVLAGENDKMCKAEEAEQLAKTLPKGHYAALKECGHMMMVEKPMDTAREVNAFIAAQLGA